MQVWHRIGLLWRNLARRQRVDQDLDEEIRSYREMLEDENLQAGADPQTARRMAMLETGGATLIKEQVNDVRIGNTVATMAAELRQAVRGLRRNPTLTVFATAMLALGIGASTTVFSIFQATLLQPLPFRDAERLVQLWETRLARGIDMASFAEANFWDLRDANRSFTDMAARHYEEANLSGVGQAQKVSTIMVTASFLRTLGVQPVLGRDFTDEEGRAGRDSGVVMLGDHFWRREFGGDPKVLGRTLRLNERSYSVIGVLPPAHVWLNDQIYVPFGPRASTNRGSWEYDVIGRLEDGVSLDAAKADLERVAGTLDRTYPSDDKGIGFLMRPSSTWVATDNTRLALWVLLGAVTLLLLIACLNVANLLLARGTARQRELAVRAALGAGRARLARFVVLESLVLSTAGAAFGIGLAYFSLRLLQTLEIRGFPRLEEASLNPWVLGFAVGVAVLSGVLAGMAPAFHSPKSSVTGALRDGDHQTGSRGAGRLRAALVTGEVALSFFLLVGAGLLIRSFDQLLNVNEGFETENRLMFSVSFPGPYWENGTGKQFLDSFLERLSALPDVVAAGAVSHRPVEGGNPGMGIDSDARAAVAPDGNIPWAGWRIVTPGYFRALGLPILRGRGFDGGDTSVWGERGEPEPTRHVVLSESLAKLLFPSEDAVGKQVKLWEGQSDPDMHAEVIGVVADSRERGLAAKPTLTTYIPYGRNALTGEFILHTRGNPMALVPTVRSLVASADPNLPVADVRSLEEIVQRSVAPQRLNASLLGIFGGLALLLAVIGIYGVLSYSMSYRTSEIGLRVALGASRGSILRMTIQQGMRPVLVGMVLGAVGAWWLSRYFGTLLFDVQPFDQVTYAAVVALMTTTALAACYLPGLRAMRTDPAIALRAE